MEVQLMMPSPAPDFNSESTNTTPYVTAPSTPQRFPTFFYSAPTSPTHPFPLNNSSPTLDPLKKPLFEEDDDFAFDFSGQLEPPSISAADELFHCGKIKPLKQPVSNHSRFTEKVFSPRCKKKDSDSFTLALNQTPGDQNPSKRGRETTTTTRDKVSSSSFRISDILSDEESTHDQKKSITHSSSLSSPLTWYNKWNLKNLLLFRSTSEGSARRIKEPMNKYSRIRKSDEDEVMMKKKSRVRSGDSRRVMRKVSAHEIHYTANRAVAEEMRKKTFLPYKSGLLGCLGFHNNGGNTVHEISRGINSVIKQR